VVTHGVWKEGVIGACDLTHLRRDNQYVWQRGRDFNELCYALTYYSLKASPGTADILNRMDEDALFGVHLFQVDDHPVSRDLPDSVREIDFIRNHIKLENPDTSILDIGAGYGRLGLSSIPGRTAQRSHLWDRRCCGIDISVRVLLAVSLRPPRNDRTARRGRSVYQGRIGKSRNQYP